jgi:PAS domain S-box-containing protein
MNKENNNGQLSPARSYLVQNVLWIASIALIYFATARLSLSFVFQPEGIAAIWPPVGLFLSSILLTRRNLRPWLVGVVFITDLIAEVLTGTPLLVSIIYSLAVTGDAVLSSWLLLRFVGEPIAFARVRDVFGFLALAVILSNGLMSLAAAAASELLPGTSFWMSWKWWSASDGIGNLLVTPFILGWASVAKTGWRTWNPKRVLEGAVLFILLALLNHIAFGYMSEHGQFSLLLTYLTFPFLLWAALRFGVCGVTSALLILAAIAIRSTVAGRVANIPDSLNAVIVVQLYLAIMAVPSLFLAAVVTERTQAAQRVADALNFNQTVLHTSPVGIVVFKASGPCVSANDAIARTLASTREQVLRQNFRQLESWKRSGMLDAAEAALAAQADRDLEAEFVTTVGEKVWLSCRFAPFQYEGESHLLLIVGDITERKRTEEALHREQEFARTLLDNIADGVVACDAKGTLVMFNRVAREWHGMDALALPPEEWGRHYDLYGPDGTTPLPTESIPLVRAFRGETVCDAGMTIVVKGQPPRHILAAGCPFFDAQHNLLGAVVVMRDFTERKLAVEKLRENELRYRTLADSGQALIWTSRPDKKCDYFNQPWLTFTGRTLEQEQGDGWADGVHPDDLARCIEIYTGAFDRRERFSMDYRLRRHDGEFRWIQDDGTTRYDSQGNFLGYIGHCLDITERKRAEEALRAKNEETERFTYSASHDLRSPLVTIQTFLGHLERDLAQQDNERVKEDWGYLRTAADKMVRLLDELLGLSRVGRKMNPLEEVPLHVVVKEALDLVAGRIAQREAKVEVTQEPVVLYGDRPRLVELFQNLVDNAVKFMGDQPSPRVEIGVELAGGEVVMFVRDNGMGIDPRHQPKLFGLFEKFDSGTEGTGIGLALVKRIVEVHGGRIWAESKGVGKGAAFRFTLAKTQRQPGATVAAGIMPPGAKPNEYP